MSSIASGVRARRFAIASTVAGLLVLAAMAAVSWWAPKAQFACNTSPWGPSTAQEAAEGFAASIVEKDGALACAVTTSRFTEASALDLMKTASASLRDPSSAAEITVTLGEQMGATTPASLQTAAGEIHLDIQAHAGQWRVLSVEPA